jgi:LAO/AO transport system kinase
VPMVDQLGLLIEQVRAGDRRALAKAITLVESTRADHRQQAAELLETLMPESGNSIRLGISGVPGVGKSTFIEALGNHLIKRGFSVAVLAVDPTSAVSGGSILGDKTRMETLAFAENAFVRPSPAGQTLGGVTRRTRESLLLCEAAGFDVILVETVGVGQSETAVADMTDMFLLLLLPAGGDELQGIKRGIMELADLILVNKADGEQANSANQTMLDYRSALQFMQSRFTSWQPSVMACSSLNNQGIDKVWQQVEAFRAALTEAGELEQNRARQACAWMWSETAEGLIADLKSHPQVKSLVTEFEQAVTEGKLPPTVAAQRLIEHYKTGG